MEGIPLQPVLADSGKRVRKAALYGMFGGQINCTDGRYVYMRSPMELNTGIYQYTLMLTCHGGRRAFIDNRELEKMTLSDGFSFTRGLPVLRIPYEKEAGQAKYDTMLFDLESDPGQEHPIHDLEAERYMAALMAERMKENDCLGEMFMRYGLND